MIAALLLLAAQAAGAAPPAKPAATGQFPGATKATAIVVGSVAEEYAWLRRHGLRAGTQSLVTDGRRAYDMIEVTDASGAGRQVWFDISSFYGRALR